MATFISHSPEQTATFAEQLAQNAAPGLVLGLDGDLGSGKTQFAKGFARGLGITEPVLSPTFGLLHIYTSGRMPLYHIDFYRLATQQEILHAGLDQFPAAGLTVVEWWDRWQGPLPPGFRKFHFDVLEENVRRITYDLLGS